MFKILTIAGLLFVLYRLFRAQPKIDAAAPHEEMAESDQSDFAEYEEVD